MKPLDGNSTPIGSLNFTFSPFSFSIKSDNGLKDSLPAIA
jgi:hypothetical protein